MPDTLIVNEIYRTLQGEGTTAGRPCVIVRLTGCNLHCTWCDTAHARDEGREMTVAEVLAEVDQLGAPLVLVSGGEPLLQPATPALLAALCDRGHSVLLETNGSRDLSAVDERVVCCVDVKCPGSGEAGSFLEANLQRLGADDEVKFVLADRADYDYAAGFIRRHGLDGKVKVIMTPAFGRLAPVDLAGWLLADDEFTGTVRLGLQWHKILWPEAERGV